MELRAKTPLLWVHVVKARGDLTHCDPAGRSLGTHSGKSGNETWNKRLLFLPKCASGPTEWPGPSFPPAQFVEDEEARVGP